METGVMLAAVLIAAGAGTLIFRAGMNYAFRVMATNSTAEELEKFLDELRKEERIKGDKTREEMKKGKTLEPTPLEEL